MRLYDICRAKDKEEGNRDRNCTQNTEQNFNNKSIAVYVNKNEWKEGVKT